MDAVVRTESLTKAYGATVAVDGLTLDIPPGVIGLVGPNGSGKSTLIRMLVGLIKPTSGEATVLGGSITDPRHYAKRVGVLIERPAFVAGLSARANLVSLARLRELPLERVDVVLRQTGLVGREHEPVRRYSLGMQQRLGIAAALLLPLPLHPRGAPGPVQHHALRRLARRQARSPQSQREYPDDASRPQPAHRTSSQRAVRPNHAPPGRGKR